MARVKRYRSRFIEDPYTTSAHATAAEATRTMDQLGISGLPVVDNDRKLIGIVTRRDLQLADADDPVSDL